MDRATCIGLLMAAGMTWCAAAWTFHAEIAWRHGDAERRLMVDHFCELAREDAQLRREE